LKQFDIVGLAGNTTRIAKQASWIYLDAGKKMANSKHFSGCVGHGNQFPPKVVSNYGPVGLECKLLDGLLLAVNSETLQRTGLRFDERFKFHLYDTDFCRSAEALKLKMGTISLSAVHQSGGNFSSDEFKRQYKDYLLKWVD
jgi:GT2 family glycosyltransferase